MRTCYHFFFLVLVGVQQYSRESIILWLIWFRRPLFIWHCQIYPQRTKTMLLEMHYRQPTTFLVRAQGSAQPERLLPHVPRGPPWFQDSRESSLHRWECRLLKQRLLWQAKATQLLGKILFWAFIFSQEEVQTPDNCAPPWKRRPCLQRLLWLLKLREES